MDADASSDRKRGGSPEAMADMALSAVSSSFRGLMSPFRRTSTPRAAMQRPLHHSLHDTAEPHLRQQRAGATGLQEVSLGKPRSLQHSLKPKVLSAP